jgi:hypothetical protein
MRNKTEVDIEQFGEYRLGLTSAEITYYLQLRTGRQHVKRLVTRFNKEAGVNTMAIGPQGQPLMYRHDVLRFTDLILEGKETYFD